MKYLLLALLLTSCTASLKPGSCFVTPSAYGISIFKVIEQKGDSFLIFRLNTKEYTTIPPNDAFKDRELIDCEIAEKAVNSLVK